MTSVNLFYSTATYVGANDVYYITRHLRFLMTKTLTFFHTSPIHIQTFDTLMAELAPEIPTSHVVNETILAQAQNEGELSAALRQKAKALIQEAISPQTSVLLCTCSTIGAAAEMTAQAVDQPILRIDKPMVETALEIGPRIIVAATLKTTLEPTKQLIFDVAKEKQKKIALMPLLCENAWASFQQGDNEAYLQQIADALEEVAPKGDVIILAQASMADAVTRLPSLPIPVLSSPRLGLEKAIQVYRNTCA